MSPYGELLGDQTQVSLDICQTSSHPVDPEADEMERSRDPNSPNTPPCAESGDPFQGLARVEVDIIIEGTTTLHIEPSSHSISWGVQPNGKHDLASMRILRPEDRVTITSPERGVLFEGPLTGVFHLLEPIHIYRPIAEHQPPPSGFMIYWSPQGVDPYTWLSFFEVHNNVKVHRHSTALVPPEYAERSAERMRPLAAS